MRRKPDRGAHDRETINHILDEALVAHAAVVIDGAPVVTPTLHARVGDTVYLHGSAASRTVKALAGGAEVCLAVSLLDGLVLARAAFRHSVNYRSVVLFGRARLVDDATEKEAALRAFVEQIVPGRWAEVRAPNDRELRATSILALPLEEASAKLRTGPPVDDEDDLVSDAWAGVLPLRLATGEPLPVADLPSGVELPAYLRDYRR